MNRFCILAVLCCLVFILGAGFCNEASAQCKHQESIDVFCTWTSTYTSCDKYVRNALETTIVNGGYRTIKPTLSVNNYTYEHILYGADLPYGDTTIVWDLAAPVDTTVNHKIMMDIISGSGSFSRGFCDTSTVYTVYYLANQAN